MRPIIIATLLIALGCRTDRDKPDTDTLPDDTGPDVVDADGDGFSSDEDCDDRDASIHPGAEEICNGLDDDCDGETDEGVVGTFHPDGDGDGYGDAVSSLDACEPPSGYVADDTDCDDDDPDTYPGAPERCDGVDNDCDDAVDEDLVDLWYADADGDGFGNAESTYDGCDPGDGWVIDASDCDDSDSTIFPGADEDCNDSDDDCDGEVDEELESSWYADADSDGFGDPETAIIDCEPGAGWVEDATDCDDANSAINPDASEICNELDDDCDGLVDDDDDSVTGTSTWYIDADADGYGLDGSDTEACWQPSGTAGVAGDCDDADPAFNPGASEDDCTDPADYNCDGSTGYSDDDGDGYAACEDCDDSDAAVNPDASELCNGVDDDCDGDLDEPDADDASTWYADTDGDGYGDIGATTVACDQPAGFVSAAYATDCDDSDADISPVDPERCNGVDDDCDGLVDDDDSAVSGTTTWYVDADEDGYGGPRLHVDACEAPSGFVADATDCDDLDASANPGADEICDGVDNDCDGFTDEPDAIDASTWYVDADADGYGGAGLSSTACTQPSGYVADSTDCDDADAAVSPGAAELCNGIDDDCDGSTDEGDATDATTWYVDADADGYGGARLHVDACEAPSGYVADATDCDDGDAAVFPGATELCNGVDDDCDGDLDEDDAADASTWYADADADGFGDVTVSTTACAQPSGDVADDTDCDDDNNTVYPGAPELCDGLDNDCDSGVDEGALNTWYADADADGYGDAGSSVEACSAPSGTVGNTGDCDDGDAAVSPDADELCNGVDDDCDGVVDEDDAIDADTWYLDHDADGFGTTSYSTAACSQPSGYVADDTDCSDYDGAVYPGATEYCNGVDDDCDGSTDEDSAVDVVSWYLDDDGDGYGVSSTSAVACDQPSGYASADLDEDCDDSDASFNPGEHDSCDGLDQDCDGVVDDDAHAGKFMLTVDTNHGYAYEIDKATAGSAAVSALDSGYKINSVAVDEDGWAVGNEYQTDTLVDIDPCTGAISTIGATGVGNSCGISFGPDGKLYGMDNVTDTLVEFDQTTAVATTIGSIGYNVTSCGMAYDCTNDVLYGATNNGDVLFKFDATTGAAYDLVYTDVPFSSVGIEYDPASGLIYAATGTDLYTVDPADGTTVFVGPLGGTNVDDLVHYPECD